MNTLPPSNKTFTLLFKSYLKAILADLNHFGPRVVSIKIVNLFSPFSTLPRKLGSIYQRGLYFYTRRGGLIPLFLSRLMPGPTGVRRYINPELGISQTFRLLNQREVRYVILRWYEKLPEWPKNEDIDILIHDDDLEKITDLFVWISSSEPVDIYTVSARLGWNSLPYYPPHVAREMLQKRQLFRDHFYIPKDNHQLLSLAYHVVLRKGKNSGIPISEHTRTDVQGEHNYIEALIAKNSQNQTLKINLAWLYQFIDDQGWMPATDTLYKYAKFNPWLRTQLDYSTPAYDEGELAVFVIRSEAAKRGFLKFITNLIQLDNTKFEPLILHKLKPEERIRARDLIRGGEWGQGIYRTSGGEPEYFYIGFNYFPSYLSDTDPRSESGPTSDCYLVKHIVRDATNRCQYFWESANLLHTPDNQQEAKDYVSLCLDADVRDELEVMLRPHIQRCTFEGGRIRRRITNQGRRAKVEEVEFDSQVCVKKTFKCGYEKFFDRELIAYKVFSSKSLLMPELKLVGDGFFITEKLTPAPLDTSMAKYKEEIIDFLKLVFSEGYFLVDFLPQNTCIDRHGQIKVIDFEFMQPYQTKPVSFISSYDIQGIPNEAEGIDLPFGYSVKKNSFLSAWANLLDCNYDDLA